MYSKIVTILNCKAEEDEDTYDLPCISMYIMYIILHVAYSLQLGYDDK